MLAWLGSSRVYPKGLYAARRMYSAAAAEVPPTSPEKPEAPEFLDEKEKAIFERLSAALEPTELEVHTFA